MVVAIGKAGWCQTTPSRLSSMPSYLFYFAHAHNTFRLPELKSIAELYGIKIALPQNPDDRDPTRPCMVIELEQEEHARILANRCILIKYVLP